MGGLLPEQLLKLSFYNWLLWSVLFSLWHTRCWSLCVDVYLICWLLDTVLNGVCDKMFSWKVDAINRRRHWRAKLRRYWLFSLLLPVRVYHFCWYTIIGFFYKNALRRYMSSLNLWLLLKRENACETYSQHFHRVGTFKFWLDFIITYIPFHHIYFVHLSLSC